MYVIKRNKTKQTVSVEKIHRRIQYLTQEPTPLDNIDTQLVADYVSEDLYDGVTTSEIDTRSAVVCVGLMMQMPEYGILASRLVVSNHQKNTLTSFKDKIDKLYLYTDTNGELKSIIQTELYKFVAKNQKKIESRIDYSRDYLFDFFGFKTLEKGYLLRVNDETVERPQDLMMRVSIALHLERKPRDRRRSRDDILNDIFATYDWLSMQYYTHATPTLYNSGLPRQQLASCFLLGVEDSIPGIFKAISDCAMISKWSGGIGFHISDIRSTGAPIDGTGGVSSGIIPFLKIFEQTALAVDQGGRRKGSFAPYIEMHHPDILNFLLLCNKNVSEQFRALKLWLALWVSDLFMQRVQSNGTWSTFCPKTCPGLSDCYGEEYVALYTRYEREGKASWTMSAREIWKSVYMAQVEAGLPYLLYKDAINRASNQKNVGIIKSSNLCSEIVEYSDTNEYAVCTLASICLPRFVEDHHTDQELATPSETRRVLNDEFPVHPRFNYDKFKECVSIMVRNLNHVIDVTHYPVPETKRSNLRHRPIGIGVQGLADVFFKFNIPFDSAEAKQLNRYIFETMYYSALSTSTKMCREIWNEYRKECETHGKVIVHTHPTVSDTSKVTYKRTEYTSPDDIPTTIGAYSTFEGSPLSQGIFHWEMMNVKPEELTTQFDWESLREHVRTFGTMNSLLIALMPTASTSQIMGNIECFEPCTSNVMIRPTIAGEFLVINKYLVHDLKQLGLWNPWTENWLKKHDGSIQQIEGIPDHIKLKYRTVWELSPKAIIDLAADRAPFVDQSQSMNLYMKDVVFEKFNSMHMYSWKKGLKTGIYYYRTRQACDPQKVTVDTSQLANVGLYPKGAAKLYNATTATPPLPRTASYTSDYTSSYTPPTITGPTESCDVCSG
jgi:ribonucleoside-diphosphate reductase alpha subunit